MDCIRICFRSNTDMEAAETDRFVKALNAAASNAFISEAAHAGNTAVDAVDVIMRCISNGAFQSPAFASLIHDNAFHDTVLSVRIDFCNDSIAFYICTMSADIERKHPTVSCLVVF